MSDTKKSTALDSARQRPLSDSSRVACHPYGARNMGRRRSNDGRKGKPKSDSSLRRLRSE
jgi:hypothetical protein